MRLGRLKQHSLGIAACGLLLLWIVFYCMSDPKTHLGAFFGNAIADWSGSVVLIFGTKFLVERGSKESDQRPSPFRDGVAAYLYEHSLLIFLVGGAAVWAILYAHHDSNAKWGQVTGNIVSEWIQMAGLVFLTKGLYERGSHESK